MKKSTLFFKVMVLLALLVPWTGWGQIPDSFWNNSSNHLGTYVIELTEGEAMNVAYDLDNYNSLSLEGYNFDNATSVKGNLPSGITASIGDEENKDVITFSGTVGSGLNGKYEVKYYISYWNENGNKSGYFTFIFQKWTEGDPKGTVKIYVDATNAITKSEPAFEIDENHRLPINLDNFDGLIDWIFSKDEVDKDQPKLSLSNTNITWGIPGNNEGILSVVGKEGLVNNLPQDGIKVKIENGSEFGYILLTFERDRTNDWKEAKKDEITVYVNAKGEIVKYDETEATDKMASILISSFEELSGWTYDYVLEGTQATSQPILDPASDNQFSWNVLVENTKLIISGTDATIEDGETVKVKVKKGSEEGYLLVTFAKDETSEEPENPNEPEWATGDAQGTVTAYVNPEGQITRVEGDGTFTNGRLSIDPEGEWKFSIAEGTDDRPVFSDMFLSKSFTWGVAGNGNLNVYGLDTNESVYENLPREVKVKIENGEAAGYVLIKFEKAEEEVSAEPEWAQGDASGEVIAYVNPEGQITRVEGDGTFTSGRLNIAPEEGWKFTIAEKTDDQPVFSDDILSKSFTWGVAGNGSLNVYGLDNNESVYGNLPKDIKVQIKNGDQLSYVLIKFVQDDDTWAQGDANATVTVYVDTKGKVVSTTPECSINEAGALTIDLDKVNEELAGWKYSPMATLEGDVTSDPTVAGDVSSLFSLMINGNGDLFVEKESTFDAEGLPTTVKVKIENGDKVGYLEVAFEKVIVIDPNDITAGGDDDNDDGVIDKNGNLFVLAGTEGEKTVYDSETHELAILKVNGLDEPLRVDEDYTVVYTPKESLVDNLPYHAGTYDVTIKLSDKYITITGAKEFATTVEITKRDLHLAFSIEENTTIEDLNEKLDLAGGLVICTPNNLAPNDDLSGVITATFTIGQEPVDGLYPVYPETIHFENTDDFDREDYNITYDYTDLAGIEHQDNITPDEDGDVEFGDGEGEIPADDPIGGIEYVDPETGEGSAGGYYEKKYRLYLAVKDKNNYYVEDAEADYKAEGLELFSRRDKKTTWAGGSFTVYYKHNDVVNEGGYRVFIKRGKHADYEEVKLDEVSGYYQIRNVQSDIYVRLYYGTGLPVANEEITATDVRAYAQANKIVVITPEPTDVQIISMAGAVVATDQVTGQREFANLAEGVYIVRMGETVIKLQVRN